MVEDVTIRLLQLYVLGLYSAGVSVEKLLARVGLDAALLFDGRARISHEKLVAFWMLAEGLTQDPELALRSVEALDARIPALREQVTEYVLMHLFANSDTVESGLERYVRAFPLQHNGIQLTLETDSSGATVWFRFPTLPVMPASLAEYCLAVLARLMRGSTAHEAGPSVVFVTREPGDPAGEWLERRFGCEVRFGAPRHGLHIPRRVLSCKPTTANPSILRIVEAQANTLLGSVLGRSLIADQASGVIRATLSSGRTSTVHVAAALGMSVRTLSRKLQEAGTSYRDLVDAVRREQAEELLRKDEIAIANIAELLGFSDLTSFERAFRRWFGHSPARHRAGGKLAARQPR